MHVHLLSVSIFEMTKTKEFTVTNVHFLILERLLLLSLLENERTTWDEIILHFLNLIQKL